MPSFKNYLKIQRILHAFIKLPVFISCCVKIFILMCKCCVGGALNLLYSMLFKSPGLLAYCITSEVCVVKGVCYHALQHRCVKNKRILWEQSFRGSCQTCPFFSNPVFRIILHCYGMLFNTQTDTLTMCCQSLTSNFIHSLFAQVTNIPTSQMAVNVNSQCDTGRASPTSFKNSHNGWLNIIYIRAPTEMTMPYTTAYGWLYIFQHL